MRCCDASSSSASPFSSLYAPFSTAAPPKRRSRPFFFFFFICKPSSVSCSTKDSPSLSTTSYSRRWYNPLTRRQRLDESSGIARHWVEADQPLASPERFTVASYNILADRNASWHKNLYSNVPYAYMNWERRKRVICKELIGWNPDIICLQEVDKYFELSDMLATAGYVGSFKRRTGGSADGCAMFWKADKFRLLEGESIEFKRFGLGENVAQLSVFEMCNSASRRLLIGNIHVLYNPRRGDVKLGQIRSLLSRAKAISEKWGNCSVVLAGDFNSTPQSAIYKFLSSSELNVMLYDKRELSGQRSCSPAQVLGPKQELSSPHKLIDRLMKDCWTDEEVRVATGKSNCYVVVHPLNLNSSYATGSSGTRGSNGEPIATSYHSKFLGTVDYLWYTDRLVPTKVVDTTSIDDLQMTGGLPCKGVGSDHLALVSEFSFSNIH